MFESDGIDEIDEKDLEAIPTELIRDSGDDFGRPSNLQGSEALKVELGRLFDEFPELFRTAISPTP